MTSRIPLPDDLSAAPFTVRTARGAGVPRSRTRARDLEAPFRGIRQVATTPAADASRLNTAVAARLRREHLQRRCAAFLVRDGRPIVFSHVTAAQLYGIPLPLRFENRDALDVAAIVPDHAPQGAGVIGHRLSEHSTAVTTWAGLPVVAPIDAWIQLGSLLNVHDLIVAGDALVRRKLPLAALDDILAAVAALHRQRGARSLRAAAADVRAGTDSPMETRTRLILIRAGLPEPVIGYTIYDATGGFVGTPDLAYVAARIAIEYEGEPHATDLQTFRDDIERRALMEEAGWRVVRVTRDHIFIRPHQLIARVSTLLRERSPR